MSDLELLETIKSIDKIGACILAVLASLAVGATYAAVHYGWFRSSWELAI